jgi:predicted PurR-regulated permease PerM
MKESVHNNTKHVVEITIRMAVLFLLFYYCFEIIAPFIMPVLWGIIIAVSVFPVHNKLQKVLGGRKSLASTLLTLLILAIIFVPAGLFVSSIIESISGFIKQVETGTIELNKPKEAIQSWPVIGKPLFEFLDNASGHLTEILKQYEPQVLAASKVVLGAIVGTSLSFLQVILSIIIAGVLLATKQTEEASAKIYQRIGGERGLEYLQLTSSTIRTVVKGVLGVAIIQAFLAGLGFYLASIPSAAILTLFALMLAIIQVGPGLIIIGVIIYLHMNGSGVGPTLWTIYFIGVMFSDNILKPILLGKGSQVPILVIFIGVTGGFLLSGFIGLFSGPIILSVGYKLFIAWMNDSATNETVDIN